MRTKDYNAPELEECWCAEQRIRVADYLRTERLKHGRIGEWPAWHVAPYVAVWAIESLIRPEWIGWWVISGDLPTDYISSADIEPPQHPRKAVRVVAERWLRVAEAWSEGREFDGVSIRGSHSELGPLLKVRATLLLEWTGDDSLWDE